jgi:hypothetical protein
MHLVGLSGSDIVNTSGGSDGYIASPWRRKWIFRRGREMANCEYELRHVCLSVRSSDPRMEQLKSHWADLHEGIFRKYVVRSSSKVS